MIYLIFLLFLYWIIGVYALVRFYTKSEDLYFDLFFFILLIGWVVWPFVANADVIIFKKRGDK